MKAWPGELTATTRTPGGTSRYIIADILTTTRLGCSSELIPAEITQAERLVAEWEPFGEGRETVHRIMAWINGGLS